MTKMTSSAITICQHEMNRYIYSKLVAPHEIIWLVLGLPLEGTDGTYHPLKLNIAPIMIFGYGNSGIYLQTDTNGEIRWHKCSVGECLLYPVPPGNEVIAYDKETALKFIPESEGSSVEKYTYEGIQSSVLNKSNYKKEITQAFQKIQHVPRVYRIQYHVKMRHQKYHKYAFTRVVYKLYEKTSVLAIRSIKRMAVGEVASDRPSTKNKPWLQKTSAPRNRKAPVTYAAMARKQKILPLQEKQNAMTAALSPTKKTRRNSTHAPRESSFFYADDADDHRDSKDATKKELKVFDPSKVVVQEVHPSAAGDLLDLTKRVAAHIGAVFKKQVTNLTLDFVKDENNNYVLIEVFGFEFANYGPDTGRVLSMPAVVQSRLESFYRCRLDGTTRDDDFDDDSNANQLPVVPQSTLTASKTTREIVLLHTVLCRMCQCRINAGNVRFCMTSVMIQSTIMHLRSRLRAVDLPHFCRDGSYTMKSMHRADEAAGDVCPRHVNATDVNLYVCELCYALYKQESKLMEVEHKLAVFTRNNTDLLEPKTDDPATSSSLHSPVQPSTPTHNTRSSAVTRPSTAPLPSPALKATRETDVLKTATKTLSSMGGSANRSSVMNESAIRDLFRAKNSPSRLASREYYKNNAEKPEPAVPASTPPSVVKAALVNSTPAKPTIKKSGTKRKGYPDPSPMAHGIRMTRPDLMSVDLTLCRMMVAIHKVADIPVPFLDVYENFNVSYYVLGRRVDAPCKKGFSFTRNRVNRFKNPHIKRMATTVGRILEGDVESSSSSSSDGESLCSDPSSGYSDEERCSDESDDTAYVITRRTSQVIEKEKAARLSASPISSRSADKDDIDDDEPTEVCVGALDVKYMRMSYFMVPGDATGDGHGPYNNFICKAERIMVVLSAKLKPNADINERHWTIPNMSNTSKAKSAQLKKNIQDIRNRETKRTCAFSHLHHLSRSIRRDEATDMKYDPRADINKHTDTGDPLPDDAICYAYLPLSQFKSSAVKRLDFGAPMTYAIKHLPKERSVPMLRAMVGIDRAIYPMDNWSLPYALIQVEDSGNVYVPDIENQFASTAPLPKEWLNVELEKNQTRRLAFGNNTVHMHDTSKRTSISQVMRTSMDIESKRAAPVLMSSQGRQERLSLLALQAPMKVMIEERVDNEQRLERQCNSVWCLCIQVVQARHLCKKEDIFAETRPLWLCHYNVFGDEVTVQGEIPEDDYDEGVVTFGTGSKHMFRGSCDALEAMFADMNNIELSVEMRRIPPRESNIGKGEVNTSLNALSFSLPPSPRTLLLESRGDMGSKDGKSFTGSLDLLDMQSERFVDITVQLHRVEETSETSRRDKMIPPYLNVNIKMFRMGPHEDGDWLPPQAKLGPDIYRGSVNKVIPIIDTSK